MEHNFKAESLRSGVCTFLDLGQCQDHMHCLDDCIGEDAWCSHTAVAWYLCTLVLTVPQKVGAPIPWQLRLQADGLVLFACLCIHSTFDLYRTQIFAHEIIT